MLVLKLQDVNDVLLMELNIIVFSVGHYLRILGEDVIIVLGDVRFVSKIKLGFMIWPRIIFKFG